MTPEPPTGATRFAAADEFARRVAGELRTTQRPRTTARGTEFGYFSETVLGPLTPIEAG